MQYLFFDVDGVLVHGYHARPELRVCWDEELAQDFGIERSRFTEEFIFGPFVREVLVGKKDLKEALAEALPRLGCDAKPQVFLDYWLERDSSVNQTLLKQIRILKETGEVRLFVATNQAHDRARYLMDTLGFGEIFEDIFHSARVGALKPDLAFFRYISDTLCLPENPKPIFFDDTPEVVSGARAFGWDAYEFFDISSLTQSRVVQNLLKK